MTPTEEQLLAINYPKSMVIIAKPGSGKTFVIAEKIRSYLSNLPAYQGVIAISFTNKATAELKKRITQNGCAIKSSCLSTIDSFCISEIIFHFLPHLWGNPKTSPTTGKIGDLSEEEQQKFSPRINNVMSREYLAQNTSVLSWYFREKGIVFVESCGALALYVLQHSHACCKFIKARYSHIFIDEYQDADKNQHEIFLFLQCNLGLTAVAVGDPFQSIFAFAGKSADFLLSLPQNPAFANFSITYNHRSHPSIINYANLVLSPHSVHMNDQLNVYEKCCQGDETSVPKWIDQCLSTIMEHFKCTKYSQIGILTPTNDYADQTGIQLQTPNRVAKSHPLETSPTQTTSLLSKILYFYFDSSITVEEVIESFNPDKDKRARILLRRQLNQFKQTKNTELIPEAIALCRKIAPFSIHEPDIQLLSNDTFENIQQCFTPLSDDKIQIMTCHKAKGLEFDIVFIIGLYAWVFPSRNIIDTQSINLHYVSITRAKKACYLCYSTHRHMKNGTCGQASPSPLLLLPGLKEYRKKL